MKHIKRIFNKYEKISVEFKNITITEHNLAKGWYGVKLEQYWDSKLSGNIPGYSDEGYLFLLFNFTDINNPDLWVRAWDPLRDDKGKILAEYEKTSLGNFRIKYDYE